MSFNENSGQTISLEEAAKMTKRYRDNHAGQKQAAGFGVTTLQTILQQTDCIGIRSYYAQNDNGEMTLVLVGVKSNGDDLYQGQIMEFGAACPPFCGSSNPLNS